MHIKQPRKKTAKKILLLAFVLFFFSTTYSQVVWENYRDEIYEYLSRLSQKGIIQFDDLIQPLSRNYIAKCLQELSEKDKQLTQKERKELAFYLKEYSSDGVDTIRPSNPTTGLFNKDDNGRWRTLHIKSNDFSMNADPIFQGARVNDNVQSFIHQSIGIDVWGRIGKHIGFQFSANDISENRNGTGTDSIAYKSPRTGFVITDSSNKSSLNYTEVKAGIGYSWKNGSFSIGQDYLLWGYGENGRIVLSDKSPAYPYLRLDYKPFTWLTFQYTHAWLGSNVVDSSQTYSYGNSVYGGQRIEYVPKYMASHTITFKPHKTLDISLGESIIYSDHLNVGYLIPVMFFKFYDNITSNNNITAGSNGQFFFQISSRNWLSKTHVYATLFIDEIVVSQVFNPAKSRNQLGFNAGISRTDFIIPYLTITAEYTRINPFVYSNLNPAQTYTNQTFNLGDWMGNNFDRSILSLKYTPFPRVKWLVRLQYIRKGGAGTVTQQYNLSEPQPPFLFNLQYIQKQAYTRLSYEWKHNLYWNAWYSYISQDNKITNNTIQTPSMGIGLSYGL